MRELTEAMRAATADPPPTSITIDQLVVRERRRRVRVRLLAAAGAVVVAAGAAPVLAAVAGPGPGPVPAPARPPLIATDEGTPDLTDLQGSTAGVAEAMADALPAGYRIAGEPTEYWAAEFALTWAEIRHPDGSRSQLLVFLDRDRGAAGAGGCTEPHPGVRFSGTEVSCRPLLVAGVLLRVSTSRDTLPDSPEQFEFSLVSHYRDGSSVHLWELPYSRGEDPELVPGPPVLTEWELAGLALHPALATP